MNLPDQAKHVIDAVTIPTGLLASVGVLVESVINPLLTMLVLFTSLVWGAYRVIDMKKKRGK